MYLLFGQIQNTQTNSSLEIKTQSTTSEYLLLDEQFKETKIQQTKLGLDELVQAKLLQALDKKRLIKTFIQKFTHQKNSKSNSHEPRHESKIKDQIS